jgi:hypothetical protein
VQKDSASGGTVTRSVPTAHLALISCHFDLMVLIKNKKLKIKRWLDVRWIIQNFITDHDAWAIGYLFRLKLMGLKRT